MTRQIHFLFKEDLEGYTFNPHRPEGLSFSDVRKNVVVQIRPRGDKTDYDYGHRNLDLLAEVSHGVTERQFDIVEKLINERTISPDETPVPLPYTLSRGEVVAFDGRIAAGYSITSDFLPDDLQSLCISTAKELEEISIRFVQLLRWLENTSGPVKIRDGRDQRFGLYWKTTQEQYYSVPWPKQGPFRLTDACGITWLDPDQQSFAQLWEAEDLQEPLGHQLLREAKDIAEHNSRSALLICYSALEVGLKQHISNCVPDAEWLAMYSPAPPLLKILKNYLPKIHNENPDFRNWTKINSELNIVKSFVEDRNKLAHRGESITGAIDDYLRITEDLLFSFDVLEGHTWAKSLVSQKFGSLLDWGPTRGGFSGTISLEQ